MKNKLYRREDFWKWRSRAPGRYSLVELPGGRPEWRFSGRCSVAGVRLLTNRILFTFAELVHHNRRRVNRVWLVSPWIGSEEKGYDPVLALLNALRGTRCSVILITRPPQEVWHERAVHLVKSNTGALVYEDPALHTKLYILECDGFRAAVVGSPNLTPRANQRNRELAIELRTTMDGDGDDAAHIISELTEYAYALQLGDNVRIL